MEANMDHTTAGGTFARTVEAAMAETVSKFKLAEALALDIPPRMGKDADTAANLAIARQAIIDAGGEDRSVETLGNYRLTAQWASRRNYAEFAWVTGASFYAHDVARMAGKDRDWLAGLEDKRVNAVLAAAGRPPRFSPRSPRANPVSDWSPDDRANVARDLMRDPKVAAAVMDDDTARGAAAKAANIWQREHQPPLPVPPDPNADDPVIGLTALAAAFLRIRRDVETALAVIHAHRHLMGGGARSDITAQADFLVNASTLIRDALNGESVDDAIAAILAEGS
jgi:hypothetical protein